MDQIGVGVRGPVYRSSDPNTDRPVAVKAFDLDLTPEQVGTLADSLTRLVETGSVHSAIVAPVAAGIADGQAYLVQEYVAIEPLDVVIHQSADAPREWVMAHIAACAAALDAAHARGLLHGALHLRDVFLGEREVRITGVAIAPLLADVGVALPNRGPYTAPEIVAGGRAWDGAADRHALAAIAYELLTGQRAVGSRESMTAHLGRLGSGCDPKALAAVFETALAAEPQERYATGVRFAAALRTALDVAGAAGGDLESPARAARSPDLLGDRELQLGYEAADAGRRQNLLPIDDVSEDDAQPATGVEPDRGSAADRSVAKRQSGKGSRAATPREPDAAAERHPLLPGIQTDPDADLVPVAGDGESDDRAAADAAVLVEETDDALHGAAEDEGVDELVDDSSVESQPQESSWGWYAFLATVVVVLGTAAYFFGDWVGSDEAENALVTEPEVVADAVDDVLPAPVGAVPATGDPPDSPDLPRFEPAEDEPAAGRLPLEPNPAGAVAASTGGLVPSSVPPPPPPGVLRDPNPSPPRRAPDGGWLLFRTEPPGATVLVDGTLRGVAPLSVRNVPFGEHTVEIRLTGFETVTREVTVNPADPVVPVPVQLTPADPETPAAGEALASLVVESRPAGARVVIDGEQVGVTPLVAAVPPGRHRVELERDGYRIWATTVLVSAADPVRIAASLEPVPR